MNILSLIPIFLLSLLAYTFFVTGCSSSSNQQRLNVVMPTLEEFYSVEKGMSQQQVKLIMGFPTFRGYDEKHTGDYYWAYTTTEKVIGTHSLVGQDREKFESLLVIFDNDMRVKEKKLQKMIPSGVLGGWKPEVSDIPFPN